MNYTKETTIQPEHRAISKEDLEKLKDQRVHIYINGNVAWELRHTAAILGFGRRLSYSDVIKVLLIGFKQGTFRTIRERPESRAIIYGER